MKKSQQQKHQQKKEKKDTTGLFILVFDDINVGVKAIID